MTTDVSAQDLEVQQDSHPHHGHKHRRKSELKKGESLYFKSPVHDVKVNERIGHGKIPKKHLSGILKVRIVEAVDIKTGAKRQFWGGKKPDPYVKLILQDNRGWTAIRRTHTFNSTHNPQWREELSFGIYKSPQDLVLSLDVCDEDEYEEDDVIGSSKLPIKLSKLMDDQWEEHALHLHIHNEHHHHHHHHKESAGHLEIMINWTPLGGKLAGGLCGFLRSPRALRILGSLQVNLCGFLLLVSYHSRWLCKGGSLEQCDDVDVPGSGACTLIACSAALFSGVHQLMGSFGFFGKEWEVMPPGLISLLEDPDELEAYHGDEEAKGLKIKADLHFKDTSHYVLSMRLKSCKVIGIEGFQHIMHMLVWLEWLVAIAMTGLGLGLTWGMRRDVDLLGEGWYVAVAVEAILLATLPLFLRSSYMEDRDSNWKRYEQVQWKPKTTKFTSKVKESVTTNLFQVKDTLSDVAQSASQHFDHTKKVSQQMVQKVSQTWSK